jgi:hypothetical protein
MDESSERAVIDRVTKFEAIILCHGRRQLQMDSATVLAIFISACMDVVMSESHLLMSNKQVD